MQTTVKDERLFNFYFTFGISHELRGRYQLIKARNEYEAYQEMFKAHGKKWAFCYSEEKWRERVESGIFRRLKPLKPITAEGGETE